MNKLEEAYNNYTKTKVVLNNDGTETHISPVGHYTNESIDNFRDKLLTNDEFDKKWSMGCTRKLTDDEVVEYFYKHIRPEQKWKKIGDRDYYYYDEKSNIWFEHSGSDILWGMRPDCPKRKIDEHN